MFAPFKGTQEESWLRLNWWIMSQFHSDGKNSCIIQEAFLPWTPSYKQDSSQVEGTQKKGGKRYSSHPWTLLVMKQKEYDDLSMQRKVHYKKKWKVSQGAVCWVKLEKAQEKWLQFRHTRSHAVCPVFDSVRADCIEKVVSLRGDKNFVSKDSYATTSSENRVCLRMPGRWSTTNNQAASNRVRRETSSKFDLRVPGVPQMQYLKMDEEWPKFAT